MEKLIEAVIRLAEAAGIRAVKAFPVGAMPALTQPCTAVGLLKAKGAGRAVYAYLGVEEQADGSLTPLYGRRLEAEVYLRVFCPRALGAQRCMQEAEKLAAALSRPSPVVRLGALTVEQCGYDAAGDCYRCTVRVEAEAYVYAMANEDETEFTDFILKGEGN